MARENGETPNLHRVRHRYADVCLLIPPLFLSVQAAHIVVPKKSTPAQDAAPAAIRTLCLIPKPCQSDV